MLEIKKLSKSYGANCVYDSFDLDFEEGRILGILGESGSGKTTLLNCMAGLTTFSGSVPKLKCSYVFQSPRLVPNLTVAENLSLVCKDDDKIADMLEKMRLTDKLNSYPAKLSGGQAQRVSLARAFLYESDIILMDEPLSALDLRLKKEITDLFLSIWEESKKTVLYVTHDIDEAIYISHRIIVLQTGKILFDVDLNGLPSRDGEDADKLRKQLILKLL